MHVQKPERFDLPAPSRLRDRGWFAAFGLLLFAAIGFASSRQDTRVISAPAGGVTGDSNNRMIAVTGVDVTGQSVLYLVDTEAMQLSVYQANGGSSGTQGIKLVGARRIDLDMQLSGFNDKTTSNGKSMTYKDLKQQFVDGGLLPADEE